MAPFDSPSRAAGVVRALGFVLALGLLAGACGGDPFAESGVDPLDPTLVIGTYDPTTLSFDVEGSTFGEYDLLAALPDTEPPRLIISSDGVAQLVFLDPGTGRLETGEGSVRMLADGVRIAFVTADVPGRLLLPQTLSLLYDETSGTLSYTAETRVPLNRLVALAPELTDEPLSDPVGGVLTVEFTPR
ncbi:MAG: hypothetical protein ACN0LA_04430 [Candidatus Longimicrobiales bacterium M2_2A_002]